MKSIEFVKIAKDIATKYKTLYIMGCFGAPMTDYGKNRYTQNSSYNKRADRTLKIKSASSDTFGFDCVCLIKGILWGWNGNLNHIYGGAKYASNGVLDKGADQIMSYCSDVSTDFSNIVPGELVHMSGHVGIYIGDGLAVECTPIWKDGVQITAVGNIGKKDGYNKRTWNKHGKLKWIEYVEQTIEEIPFADESDEELAARVWNGEFGNGKDRSDALGSRYDKVQALVNEGVGKPQTTEKPSVDLKVGDRVQIIRTGNGSSLGNANTAYGIGWERQILKIWEGRPYPYQVGTSSGTIGFYTSDALKKI